MPQSARREQVGSPGGAAFYIEPSATEELDAFVVFADQPLSLSLTPVYAYLVARGAIVDGEHLVIADWPVQFLPATTPLVEEALRGAVRVDVEGQPVPVFTEEHLAAIALETGRLKDKVRLAQFLESRTFDRTRFDALVTRYNLVERWIRFTTFLEDHA